MRKIFVILFFTLILYLPTFGQFWGENFNTKQYNDFTETGWRFNEDGTFNISTNNDFNMTSRHIRSQLIYNNSLVVTYTGYLYYIGGTTYTTSFDYSCVCYDVNDNNALPRIEVAYESFTTGNIVSTSGSYITNKNILNNATSTFTPTTSGWYRIRLTLSRNINNGQAMVAIDNFTSNVPTTENWFDTTVPMDQSFNISASETIVENGDNVKFTVDYTLNNAQWYTRVKGAEFQIDLPNGFTYQSHTITGWNYNIAQTNYNMNTGVFTIWTSNIVPVIKLEINTVATNAQADLFASIYISNYQPQNLNSQTLNPEPIEIIPNSAQPIELIYFDANAKGTVNEITWATATEKNNNYFSIERSVDGINFHEIAKVPGAGDYTGHLDYKYTDLRPLDGTSYYRIRQTDCDGTFSIFQAIRVQRNEVEATAFKIVGNPSDGNRVILHINIEANVHNSTIRIFDNSGLKVAQRQINTTDLCNNKYILDDLNLSNGLHIVSFETAGKKYSERLIVK